VEDIGSDGMGGSMKRVSDRGNESGAQVVLQPSQQFTRDLFRFVLVYEMSGIRDLHYCQIGDEIM
jgi:hypothetical protein